MRFCKLCGKQIDDFAKYCVKCGAKLSYSQSEKELNQKIQYQLPKTLERKCDIKVFDDVVVFEGEFWYLHNAEFMHNQFTKDIAYIKDYMGMGYIRKRSDKQCFHFVCLAAIMQVVKLFLLSLNKLVYNVNNYLKWFDMSIDVPRWTSIIPNIIAIVCIVLAIRYFFSKKKMIEISFVNKRICIPENSLSVEEFKKLHHALLRYK